MAMDYRRKSGNYRHKLNDVLIIAFLAMMRGTNSYRGFHNWGVANIKYFRVNGIKLERGIPSHQTFSRIFSSLPISVLKKIGKKLAKYIANDYRGRVIAIDGKAQLHAEHEGKNIPYIVSAYVTSKGVVAGELKTDVKSNEIKAIYKILAKFKKEIEGAIITMDAAGCQKEAVKIIREINNAHYIIGLKGNQKIMLEEFSLMFRTCLKLYPDRFKKSSTVSKDHGRFEHRICIQTDMINWFQDLDKWAGLRSVIMIITHTQRNGKDSVDCRYYISSLPVNPKIALHCVRQHWGVENRLHLVEDMELLEDDCLVRKIQGVENLSTLRHIIVGYANQIAKKNNITTRQQLKLANYSTEELFEMLFDKAQ